MPRRAPLPAGQLRAMVLAHLTAFPDTDFSPADLARVLDRPKSRGAVANACTRLVEVGLAVQVSTRPARYRDAATGATSAGLPADPPDPTLLSTVDEPKGPIPCSCPNPPRN